MNKIKRIFFRVSIALLCSVSGYILTVQVQRREQPYSQVKLPDGVLKYTPRKNHTGDHWSEDIDGTVAIRRLAEKNIDSFGLRTEVGLRQIKRSFIPKIYSAISDDGRLTWGIRDVAGLTDKASSEIQLAIDKAFEKLEEAMKSNLTVTKTGDSDEATRWKLQVASFEEEGQKLWSELKNDIYRIAGRNSGDILISALNQDKHFANLGRQNIILETMNDRHGNSYLHVTRINPVSGASSAGRVPISSPEWINILWSLRGD